MKRHQRLITLRVGDFPLFQRKCPAVEIQFDPGRAAEGRSILPAPGALLLAESDPEVAGQVYQRLVEGFNRLVRLFGDRLDYPEGSLEQRVVASSLVALWFVAVHGWPDSAGEDAGPPMAVNELLLAAFSSYSEGLAALWAPPILRKGRGQ